MLGIVFNLDGRTGTPAGVQEVVIAAHERGVNDIMLQGRRKQQWPPDDRGDDRKGITWQTPADLPAEVLGTLNAWRRRDPQTRSLSIYLGCVEGHAPNAGLRTLSVADLRSWVDAGFNEIVLDWMGGTLISEQQAMIGGLDPSWIGVNRRARLVGRMMEAALSAGIRLAVEPMLVDADGRMLASKRPELCLMEYLRERGVPVPQRDNLDIWCRGSKGATVDDVVLALDRVRRVWLNVHDQLWPAIASRLRGGIAT